MTKLVDLNALGTFWHEVKDYIDEKNKIVDYDLVSYGVRWDATVISSTCDRVGNPLLHKSLPIQSQMKRCIVLGDRVNYWLDPNNSVLKENGELARLDGKDGVVKVRIPKFYGRSWVDGNMREVRISLILIDETWTEIPELYLDAYQPTLLNTVPEGMGYLSTLPVNAPVSVVNTETYCRGGGNRSANDTYLETNPYRSDLGKPRTNISRPSFRGYASAAGTELLTYDIYKWIVWLYVIEYANFNSQLPYVADLTLDGYHQGGLGPGATSWGNNGSWNGFNGQYPVLPNGCMNMFGNFSGAKTFYFRNENNVELPITACQYRGLENFFGHVWTFVDGIVFQRLSNQDTSVQNVYTGGHTDNILLLELKATVPTTSGIILDWDLQETGELIPKAIGQRSLDNWYNSNSTSARHVSVGGGLSSGDSAGLFAFNSCAPVWLASSDIGCLTMTIRG